MFLELRKLKEYASGERQGAPPLSLLADAVREIERLRDPFPPGHLGDWCLQMRNENDTLRAHIAELEAENLRLRKIAAHVPAKTYIAAKETAGYGAPIKSRSAGCVCGTGVFCAPCAFPE